MGQYHKLFNLDKKQFVHPHNIGNGLKLLEQVGVENCTATALVMLLAGSSGRGGGDFRDHPLIGSWAGDRIAFIGDYCEDGDIKGLEHIEDIYRSSFPKDERDEDKPIHPDVGEYTDISARVRQMLSAEFGVEFTQLDHGTWHASDAPAGRPDMVIRVKP